MATKKATKKTAKKASKKTKKPAKVKPFVKRAKVAKAVKAAKTKVKPQTAAQIRETACITKTFQKGVDKLFKATPKQLGKATVKGAKAKPLSLQGICYEPEQDTNFENNVNITFVNAIGAELNEQERVLVQAAVEKIGLDVEPIMKDVYSGDFYNLDYLERELVKLGASKTCLITNPTDVMAIVREQEAQDAADRKAGQGGGVPGPAIMGVSPTCTGGCCPSGGCNGSCGGSCGGCTCSTPTSPSQFAPEAASTNPADYYFKAVNDPSNIPSDSFLITPKADWDARKVLYDSATAIEPFLSTNGFEELQDAEYEYINGTPQAGRTLLLSLGFVENLNL
jgi:hypothetical protein